MGPAIILIIFPALFTQVINLDGIESFWFSIPVINILLALRELLLDRVIIEHVDMDGDIDNLRNDGCILCSKTIQARRYCYNIVMRMLPVHPLQYR